MLTKLFKALGVQTINSQTFANGYYYEYSLETNEDNICIMRKLRNRTSITAIDEPKIHVETDEQKQQCLQAIMYNFPHIFDIEGNIIIDLNNTQEDSTDTNNN